MEKYLLGFTPFLTPILLSGYSSIGDKNASIAIIYMIAAVISLLLLVGCCLVVREKRAWIILLFSSVLVVNIGYTLLSVSTGLEMALQANRIAYLGSVFLPLSMLMIIVNVTNTRHKGWLPISLFLLSVVVFLIAASPGISDIYYKEVSFQVINGISTLVKVYGPLHPVYLFYLLGYFAAMIAVIIRASAKKAIDSTAHAVILAIAVFVNIGVWLIEQMSDIEFEMLSISYIISELFLLGSHMVINENQRLKELVQQKEKALLAAHTAAAAPKTECISAETKESFARGLETLTPTERTIFDAYRAGLSTKEILLRLNIKENTLKFHNKNLYSKLGVSSRKQLLAVDKACQKDTQPMT